MKELKLMRLLNRSYLAMGLKYYKLVIALLLIIMSSLLEVVGVSLLYPLTIALSGGGGMTEKIFSHGLWPESLINNRDYQIAVILTMLALAFAVKNLMLYFSYKYNISYAMYFYKNLIKVLYIKNVGRKVLDFRRDSSGVLTNLICVQSERVVHGVIRPLLVLTTELIIFLAVLTLLIVFDPGPLLFVFAVTFTVVGAYYLLLKRKASSWGLKRLSAASTLHELVNITSNGIKEVKIYKKEKYLFDRIRNAAEIETSMFKKAEMFQVTPRYLLESAFIIAFISSLVISIFEGQSGAVVLSKIAIYGAAAFRLLPSINRMSVTYSNIVFNTDSATKLLKIIVQDESNKADKSEKIKFKTNYSLDDVIELKNLSFKYPSNELNIIENVSVSIEAGKRIGFYGESGSGKSTLIEILSALYEPTYGSVCSDGESIFTDADSWQNNIGYVPQVPFIIPGAIKDNVCFSSLEECDGDRVELLLGQVGLSEYVSSLQHGINTEIGDGAVELSGGQKQRLCIARALYRKPLLLLLDEPTAALDPKSQEMVLKTINDLPHNVTIIMVSHNHDNFVEFDDLYRFEHGAVQLDS